MKETAMFDQIVTWFPERWRELAEFALAPIAWIPRLHGTVQEFFMDSPSLSIALLKYVVLLFPMLLALAAVWCTQLSLYTLPFRSRRIAFMSTMLLMWWDAARMIWLYWVGLVRVIIVLGGWLITLAHMALKLVLSAVRQVAVMPFTLTGRIASSYFQPGVPWIAFVMLMVWCVIEATIFTYTLFPTVSDVLANLTGAEDMSRYMTPILWVFLLMLIMGSFACVQAFAEAIRTKEMKFIVQIVLVELFVMVFEVMFLYRELVDSITPWIAMQTGDKFRPGIGFTLSLATFGWVGIRGMTWFLFGRYGTPSLLAFISRQPLAGTSAAEAAARPTEPSWWREPINDFKREVAWLHEKSDQLVEYLALPALHVLAAAVNFVMVLLNARPLFTLPFKGLREAMETRELLATLHLHPKEHTL
jgi:hypothetical protein